MSEQPRELMDILRDQRAANDEHRMKRRSKAGTILQLGTMERLGDLIEIEVDEETNSPVRFVAEIISGTGRGKDRVETSVYQPAINGLRVPERFYSVDEALIAAVAYRYNGLNDSRYATKYAVRMLGIPATD